MSPPKQAVWNPPFFIDPRLSNHMLMYPPMLLHRGPPLNIAQQDIRKSNETEISQRDCNEDIKINHSPTLEDKRMESVSLSSPVSSLSSATFSQTSPQPLHCHTSDIHPAFPYTNTVSNTSIDAQALAAYYKGIIQNPSYPNIMFLPPTMFPVPTGSRHSIYESSLRNVNKIEENVSTEEVPTA